MAGDINKLSFVKQLKRFRILGEQMIKHIANLVTGCRILGSVLLFFPAFSVEFYIIYIFCGFSDMIDGTIARKLCLCVLKMEI